MHSDDGSRLNCSRLVLAPGAAAAKAAPQRLTGQAPIKLRMQVWREGEREQQQQQQQQNGHDPRGSSSSSKCSTTALNWPGANQSAMQV
jgi:hypothetical protein